MEKFYTITIEGAIQELQKTPELFNSLEVDFYDDFISIQELPEHQFDQLIRVEKAIKDLSKTGQILTIHKQGRSSNYVDADFEEREIINFSCLSNSLMSVHPPLPTRRIKCQYYRNWAVFLEETSLVKVEIDDSEHELTPLLAHTGYYFIHKDLLDELNTLGFNTGLQTRPVQLYLNGSKQMLEAEYFWMYSVENLGNISGDVTLGKYDLGCQHPEIIENRNFVSTFSKQKYQGHDFCTSNYSGANSLYISKRVYDFFKKKQNISPKAYDLLRFIPINLM